MIATRQWSVRETEEHCARPVTPAATANARAPNAAARAHHRIHATQGLRGRHQRVNGTGKIVGRIRDARRAMRRRPAGTLKP